MRIICQTCSQILPRTAVMCPNCGGRIFLPESTDVSVNGATNSNVTPSVTSPWQAATPMPTSSQMDNSPSSSQGTAISPIPAYQAPMSQQTTAIPPITPTQVGDVQPSYSQSSYVQPMPQPMAQPTQPVYAPAVDNTLPPSYQDGRKLASNMQYTGVVRRGLAYGFDIVLIGVLLALIYQLGLPKLADAIGVRGFNDQSLIVAGTAIYLLYMAVFTSSGRQATIGKIIMGLWVFGMQGQRIGFFRALFREMMKVVLLPLFFIMWLTPRKQTLTDLIARTVVLYDPH